MSKGSRRRAALVSDDEVTKRWGETFGKLTAEELELVDRAEAFAKRDIERRLEAMRAFVRYQKS